MRDSMIEPCTSPNEACIVDVGGLVNRAIHGKEPSTSSTPTQYIFAALRRTLFLVPGTWQVGS